MTSLFWPPCSDSVWCLGRRRVARFRSPVCQAAPDSWEL